MQMADEGSGLPLSKKRVAGRELNKDNADLEDDTPEQEMGTFQRASDEVLATRRIVKVRRNQSQSSAASSNPFAGLRFTSPSDSSANTTSSIAQPQISNVCSDDKTGENVKIDSGSVVNEQNGQEEENIKLKAGTEVFVTEDNKNPRTGVVEAAIEPVGTGKEVHAGGEKTQTEASEETGKETEKEAGEDIKRSVHKVTDKYIGEETEKEAKQSTEKIVKEDSEKENSVDNQKDSVGSGAPVSSFQQLSSNQNAFAGLAKTGFSSSSFSFGPISEEGSAFASCGSVSSFKTSNNESSFGTGGADATKTGLGGSTAMKEVPVETGEENEEVVFSAGAILYEYVDSVWRERGKGELKVNTSIKGVERARLVMRARGNYRLILNANLYPDMLLTDMEKRGVTFACVNSAGEGKGGLTTFALKFKDSCTVGEFRSAVTAHKGKKTAPLKTPENSPKASDE